MARLLEEKSGNYHELCACRKGGLQVQNSEWRGIVSLQMIYSTTDIIWKTEARLRELTLVDKDSKDAGSRNLALDMTVVRTLSKVEEYCVSKIFVNKRHLQFLNNCVENY